METCCFLFRNFIRGFIQGIGIMNYFWQIISLGISDILVLILCCIFRNQFFNTLAFLCIFCYHFLFLSIDLCFLLIFKSPLIFGSLDYDQLLFALICALIVSLLLFIICVTIANFLTFCRRKRQ